MMVVIRFFSEPFWQQLGLTLMHFLWQGLAIAALLAIIVRLFRLGPGRPRYTAYLAAFLLMTACPPLTFITIARLAETEVAPSMPAAAVGTPGPSETEARFPVDTTRSEPTGLTPALRTNRLESWLAWAVAFWMVGVAILSIRLLLGFVGVWRWRRDLRPLPDEFTTPIARLSERLALPQFSRIFISPAVGEATAIGYLRPMVLLPVGMLTQMDPAMVEAVVAHELAHIRRLDLWINLAQRIVETLLFYHPAVWWLSNRLRIEREFCCDEIAVATTGERLTYASALEAAQRECLVATQPTVAVGLGQGKRSTLSRVRHILGLPPMPPDSRFWPAGLVAAVILAVLTIPAISVLTARAQAGPATDTEEKPAKTLHQAVASGDLGQIRRLVARGANVNTTDRSGLTPLHLVAKWRPNVVVRALNHDDPKAAVARIRKQAAILARLLVINGAEVNARDDSGNTPLHYAAERGHENVAELLIAEGADINARDKEGKTPLHSAATSRHKTIVELLLSQGADVHAKTNFGSTPLHYAASYGDADTVKALLDAGAHIDQPTGGRTAIHLAVCADRQDIVNLLVDRGATIPDLHVAVYQGNQDEAWDLIASGHDVNAKDRGKFAPIHFAVCGGQKQMLSMLINRGADVNARGWRQRTTLHLATQQGNLAMVEELLAQGATVDATGQYGHTPLYAAAGRGHAHLIEPLLRAGADINVKVGVGGAGYTPLHLACRNGHYDIVQVLLRNGADLDAKDDKDQTPLDVAQEKQHSRITELLRNSTEKGAGSAKSLHQAAADGDVEKIKLILSKATDVNERDAENQTALHHAVKSGRKKIVALLLAAGADVNAQDESGFTPLTWAIWQTGEDIVDLLLADGADISQHDTMGCTPLYWAAFTGDPNTFKMIVREETKPPTIHLAAYEGDLAQVKAFMEEGIDVDTKDEFGCTALHWASAADELAIVDFLIAQGAKLNAKVDDDKGGFAPLTVARSRAMIERLISNGADLNIKTFNGRTRLHGASMNNEQDSAELLIQEGANLNAKDKWGNTPLHLAASKGHLEVAKLLLQNDADVNAESIGGNTALSRAREKGRTQMVELLRKHEAQE